MEVPIGLVVLSGVIGLILKWARDNARRDQKALVVLRDVIEGKKEEISGRKSG